MSASFSYLYQVYYHMFYNIKKLNRQIDIRNDIIKNINMNYSSNKNPRLEYCHRCDNIINVIEEL